VIDYNAQACFVPGNTIPNFFPGLKVQLFHGLEWKKKSHFIIRDCFDLYCTHGPITTSRFNTLKQKHQNFNVMETGWPKIDALFDAVAMDIPEAKGPIILYAPTFSPKLTSAPELFSNIKLLSQTKPWFWMVKFHPKMDPKWIAQFQAIENQNLKVINTDAIAPFLQTAHLMVSDTSSVIGEFALLKKPTITFNNAAPDNYVINITHAGELESTIQQSLTNANLIESEIIEYIDQLHPYYDGKSSKRVMAAVTDMIERDLSHLKARPKNLLRNIKMRMKLNYWKG